MKRVLVTRPEPGATATAGRLRGMGFDPVVLPLSRVVAMPLPESYPRVDVVAVTSTNAIRLAPEPLIQHYSRMLCYVVGEKTAAAAREAGFDTVRVGDGDARSMADLVVTETVGKGTVAYLAGRVRLSAFEEALQLAGLKVFPIDVYDTESVEPTVQDIQMLKAGRPIDAVLIYSARAADAVQQLSHRPDLHEAFSSVLYCCISHRVAAHFDALDSKRIRVADRPEEAAIFALLHE